MIIQMLRLAEIICNTCLITVLTNEIPEPEDMAQEVRHIHADMVTPLTQALQVLQQEDSVNEMLPHLYAICLHNRNNTADPANYKAGEWRRKIDAMIHFEVASQKEQPYIELMYQLERLEKAHYYKNDCLRNMINSYVCRRVASRKIPLVYPSSGLRLIANSTTSEIGNYRLRCSYQNNFLWSFLYKQLPFVSLAEIDYIHSDSRRLLYNKYVDVFQMDPIICYGKQSRDDAFSENIICPGVIRLSAPSLHDQYHPIDGYIFDSISKQKWTHRRSKASQLESTPILDILQWTPEVARNHPRYVSTCHINNTITQITLQLKPPCKSKYFHLFFYSGKMKRINYSALN